MPTSPEDLITPVISQIRECAVRHKGVSSVLDLGCGDGFYGAAMRRCSEHAFGRFGPDAWQMRLVGVEGHEGFRTPMWDFYDNVHVMSLEAYFKEHNELYDVVLALDVFEHMPFAEALRLLREAYDRANKAVIVSSPKPRPEDGVFVKPWQPEDGWGTELMDRACGLLSETAVEPQFIRYRVINTRGSSWLAVIFNEYLAVG